MSKPTLWQLMVRAFNQYEYLKRADQTDLMKVVIDDDSLALVYVETGRAASFSFDETDFELVPRDSEPDHGSVYV